MNRGEIAADHGDASRVGSWYRKQLADLILKVVDIWCDIDPEVPQFQQTCLGSNWGQTCFDSDQPISC
jgi:hypothetical protein